MIELRTDTTDMLEKCRWVIDNAHLFNVDEQAEIENHLRIMTVENIKYRYEDETLTTYLPWIDHFYDKSLQILKCRQ